MLFCCLYRSPNSSNDNNLRLCEFIDDSCRRRYINVIIVGDFNYSHINWVTFISQNSTENKFMECLQDNYLSQLVMSPTRRRGADRSNILDLIITKD